MAGVREVRTAVIGGRDPALELRTRLAAPLGDTRSHGLHYLVLVPPFEGADILPLGRTALEGVADFAKGDFSRNAGGTASRINGTHSELGARLRYGLYDSVELRAYQSVGGRDGDLRISTFNRAAVPEGKSDISRGDTVLGFKYLAFRSVDGVSGMSWAFDLKLPSGNRGEMLSTGGADLGLTGAITQVLGGMAFHAQGSFVVPGKERLLKQSVVLGALGAFAGGVTFPGERWSFIAQIEGNSNAFGALGAVQDQPIGYNLGLRTIWRDWTLEAGVGRGMTIASSDFVGTLVLAVRY